MTTDQEKSLNLYLCVWVVRLRAHLMKHQAAQRVWTLMYALARVTIPAELQLFGVCLLLYHRQPANKRWRFPPWCTPGYLQMKRNRGTNWCVYGHKYGWEQSSANCIQETNIWVYIKNEACVYNTKQYYKEVFLKVNWNISTYKCGSNHFDLNPNHSRTSQRKKLQQKSVLHMSQYFTFSHR